MSKKLVTHTFGNHPQFAEKRLARLKALENKPDEKIDTPKQNHFQDSLAGHYAFFNFSKHYLATHTVARDFAVDDAAIAVDRQHPCDRRTPASSSYSIRRLRRRASRSSGPRRARRRRVRKATRHARDRLLPR